MAVHDRMNVKQEGKTLILERVFDAPRELVFTVFTEAEHLKKWWGPRGWTLSYCTVDLRPGGAWHYCMKCEDKNQGDWYGMESWGKAIYGDIDRPERLAFTDYFSDAEGSLNKDLPPSASTLSFVALEDGKTKLVNVSEYDSEAALQTVVDMGMIQGVTETWDRLAELLAEMA